MESEIISKLSVFVLWMKSKSRLLLFVESTLVSVLRGIYLTCCAQVRGGFPTGKRYSFVVGYESFFPPFFPSESLHSLGVNTYYEDCPFVVVNILTVLHVHDRTRWPLNETYCSVNSCSITDKNGLLLGKIKTILEVAI